MKLMKKLFFLLLLISGISVNAQVKVSTYKLSTHMLNPSEKTARGEDNPASNSISDIVVVGDTIWIGTSRGLSRSTDNGRTWTNYYGTPAFGEESISAIRYYNGVLWCATAHSIEKNGQSVSEGGGLRYTTDNGETWKTIPQPVDAPGDSSIVYGINTLRALPVTVAAQNLTYDIAIVNNTIFIASFAGGLRKSTDMGQTWQRVVLPPDHLSSISPTDTLKFSLQPVAGAFGKENYLNHRVFSVISDDSGYVYAGTAGGVNKSTDGGVSWRKFRYENSDSAISGNFVVALAFNPADRSLWAATWRAEGSDEYNAVSYSYDRGESWTVTLKDMKAHNFGFKGTDALSATDDGVFRTSNSGKSWVRPVNIIDSRTGLALRTDEFYAAASSDSTIFLGSSDGLVRFFEEKSPWEGQWSINFASQALSSSSDTYAFPNPFAPGLETLKIKYSTGGERQRVTIRIFDFGMNLVRTVIENAERGNPIHTVETTAGGVIDFWDGRDEGGAVVPNGVYFYRVDLDSGDPVYGKILVVR